MKLVISLFFVLFAIQYSYSVDYTKIDKQSATVPTNLKTAAEIAQHLTKNLSTSSDKARAIYYWIANTISYDFSMLNSNKKIVSKEELVKEILEKRMGVCANYAELYNDCCNAVGVQSVVITGFTKTDDKIADIAHAWNAVFIDGKYLLVDVTWASGSDDNGTFKKEFIDKYFLITPEEFIKTHKPFDPIWQFLDNPLTNKEFEKSYWTKLKLKGNFNYLDSIHVHRNLDEFSRLIRENKRIIAQGLTNNMVKNIVASNQHNIKVHTFNKAVLNINNAVQLYNQYIMSKNKQFNGLAMKDHEVLELLTLSREKTDLAEKSLKLLNSDDVSLNNLIADTLNSIKSLKTNLDTEDDFMKKYIKTWKPLRIFLFTKITA